MLKTAWDEIKFVLFGLVFGIANVIPGVSGGTMAVIMNVYDRLLETLSLKNLKKNIPFIIPFLIGAAIGIYAFSNAITYLLEHFPIATKFTFIGLILGSVPMIFQRAGGKKFRPVNLIPFLFCVALMIVLGIASGYSYASTPQTELTVPLFFLLIVLTAISAFAMILPGISGSLVMMIFGVYFTVTQAIKDLNIILLIPVAIGVLIGLVFGSKLITLLLKRCPEATYAAILGLILGSLYSLYPGFALNWEGAAAIVLMLAGGAAAYFFSLQKKA